ncbi:MAG: hypothetical protein IJU64_03385 [Bacilli bacterium]|nr:hypothetical protein [Bacilli bacterium]
MLKRLIRGQILSWIPVFAASAVSMTVIFLIVMVSNQITVYCEIYRSAFFIVPPVSSGLLGIVLPAMGVCFVIPPIVYSYRTTRQGSDAYQQSAYGPHTIQRVRALVGLVMLLAAFSVAYLVGVVVFAARYGATPEADPVILTDIRTGVEELYGYYYRKVAELIYYLPVYFYLLLALIAQYGINCLACSFGNSKATQFILMAGFAAVGSLFLSAPATFISQAIKDHFSYWGDVPWALDIVTACDYISYYAIGPFAPVRLCEGVFDGLIGTYIGPEHPLPEAGGHAIAAASFHVGVGLPCFVYALFRKEPSGELAGVDGTSNAFLSLIPHFAILFAGILLTTVAYSRGTRILYTGILLAGYYALLAVFRHDFRLRKIDWVALALIATTLLAISLGYNPKHSRTGW